MTVREVAKWAFPSAVSVIAFVAFIVWAIASWYARSFYGFFSLRLHELGISYLDILERSVPSIALLALFCVPAAVFVSLQRREKSAGVKRPALVIPLFAVVVAVAVGVGGWTLQELGYRDADAISTSKVADYSTGFLQSTFASPLVVAWANWSGTPSQSPLLSQATDSSRKEAVYHDPQTGQTWNLVRLIGRNEDVTFYLSIADCQVYRAPSSLLVFQNPPLGFIPSESGSSSPMPACPSRFP